MVATVPLETSGSQYGIGETEGKGKEVLVEQDWKDFKVVVVCVG